jgi:hypothetical protein
MSKFNNKLTNLINSQVPQFVVEDHPNFVEFLKAYYKFMESAELSVTATETTDGIILEADTNIKDKIILNASKIGSSITPIDEGDKVLLESSSYGKFTNGEIIIGQTSNATSTILAEDLVNNRLFISAQDKFIIGETIVGQTSNATGTIINYKPNPVQTIQELLNFRDPDKVIANFLNHFKNEFLNTLPDNLDSSLNIRNLIKNIKYIYGLKGTSEGNNLFFRLLFNEGATTTYPREQILRASDGKWNTSTILRAITVQGETNKLIGRTITGQTSGSTAIVETVTTFQIGADTVTEFILNAETIDGNFQIGEELLGTEKDQDSYYIKLTVTGIPNNPVITNGGSLYISENSVSVSGGGEGALIQTQAIGHGKITHLFIDNPGQGYNIGDDLVFNNANTNGGGAVAKVSIVNGGFVDETLGEDRIVLEDATQEGDYYSGNVLVQEAGTGIKDITDIRFINEGSNYTSLPTVTINTVLGMNAAIKSYGDNIGSVRSLKVIEPGKGYENSPSPTLSLSTNILFLNRVGNFIVGETITGLGSDGSSIVSATIVSINNNTNILRLKNLTGTFGTNVVITGQNTGAYATVAIFNQATAEVDVVSILDTTGAFLNSDGKVSESTMKIEDNLLYQDFSYVISVGRSINDWRNSFKKTMHPAGFYFQNQVLLSSRISAKAQAVQQNLLDILKNIYFIGTYFRRKLGTLTDSTTLSNTPVLGQTLSLNNPITLFVSTTRDTTLRTELLYSLELTPQLNIRDENIDYRRFGYASAGPRMRNINRFGFTTFSGSGNAQSGNVGNNHTTATYISPMTMANWADFRIIGTKNTDIDGELTQIQDINVDNLKTYIALPTEITVTQP